MQQILEEIVAQVRARTEAMKRTLGPNDEGRLVAGRPDTPRGFTAALSPSSGSTIVVADFKRACPGVGEFAPGADPADLSAAAEAGGAAAVAVATEKPHFGGSVEDLLAAREATRLPVLRRDFIVDPYQVPRTYGTGADAIDVVVRAVPDDATLRRIFDSAERLRLDVLSEVFDEDDVERLVRVAADAPSALRLVGICDGAIGAPASVADAARLAAAIPESAAIVHLGGVVSREQVEELRAAAPRVTRFFASAAAFAAADDPAAFVAALRDGVRE